MTLGVFACLSRSYFQSTANVFYYVSQAPLLLKPLALVVALCYTMALVPIGAGFGSLVVFDWAGWITDAIRKALLGLMDRQSWSIANSFMSFLVRPIVLLCIAPLFLLSLFIPKLSSNALVNVTVNEASAMIGGAGSFRRINAMMWRAANQLFVYLSRAPLLLKPLAAMVAAFYSLILIGVGMIFLVLVPLDWISDLAEKMRQGVVTFTNIRQRKIRYSMGSFLFMPILLVALAPIFLAIILVPKFTTSLDTES